MNEAFYIANLFYYMNESRDTSFNNNAYYVISNNWYEKWRKYVNFDYFMEKTDKFIKLSYVKDVQLFFHNFDLEPENFLSSLDDSIKNEIGKYFDNFFLSDNKDFFPGPVANKELLYDQGLHYTNFSLPKDFRNYNIMDQFENGRDFIIVTQQIWSFYKTHYGGKEIKRFPTSFGASGELLIESKLKNISLCIVRIKNDKMSFTEAPKLVFFPRRQTLFGFKKHLQFIFSFLKGLQMSDIRLWILDNAYKFSGFEDYTIRALQEINFEPNQSIPFPGLSLELIDQNKLIGDIDEMINNKIIVLEYKDHKTREFIFKKQKLFDFSQYMVDNFIKFNNFFSESPENNRYNYEMLNQFSVISTGKCTDSKKINEEDNERVTKGLELFKIRNFFSLKYNIKNKENEDAFKEYEEADELKKAEILQREIDKEIKDVKEHLYLIMDKADVIKKYSYSYNNPDVMVVNTTGTSVKKNFPKIVGSLSRQDMIMKKRERTKLLVSRGLDLNKLKKQNVTLSNNIANDFTQYDDQDNYNNVQNNIDQLSEKEDEKCNYCTKSIDFENDEYILCDKCSKIKYCNSTCRGKDSRFHRKKCSP